MNYIWNNGYSWDVYNARAEETTIQAIPNVSPKKPGDRKVASAG